MNQKSIASCLLLLVLLNISSCQTPALQKSPETGSGCFAKEHLIINQTSSWTIEDYQQLVVSVRECKKRFNRCLKVFTKVADKGYTVLCGGSN